MTPDELQHSRHFTLEEANAMVEQLTPTLEGLREARDRLTDEEVHVVLTEAAPTNGGGKPGTQVGEAFLEVRRTLVSLQEQGIVVRDIEHGLIDFPSIRDGEEIYLCWKLGEAEVGHWHPLDEGFQGRREL